MKKNVSKKTAILSFFINGTVFGFLQWAFEKHDGGIVNYPKIIIGTLIFSFIMATFQYYTTKKLLKEIE